MEDLAMTNYDFAPFWRSSIGFDRLFDLVNSAPRGNEDAFPMYDIERVGDDRYQITLALAGYSPDNVSVTAEQNVLTVEGRKEDQKRDLLYHGISGRSFKRQFNLADHVQVTSANFDNGLLQIGLLREVPEAKKPRKIEIASSPRSNVEQLTSKAA
jgi:molecular chaperone IbpA